MNKSERDRRRIEKYFDEAGDVKDKWVVYDTGHEYHGLPMEQPWHIPNSWCFCQPQITDTHPITHKRVFSHRNLVH